MQAGSHLRRLDRNADRNRDRSPDTRTDRTARNHVARLHSTRHAEVGKRLANAKKGTDFTDQPFVDEHGVHGRELDRAVSVARLMIADAPKTREALVVVEAARKNLTEAWGKALTSNATRQPLPMDLAGPVIQGEAVLEKAFERLTEAATGELVAIPVTASVDHRLRRFWRR